MNDVEVNKELYALLQEGVSRAAVALAYFSKPEELGLVEVPLVCAIDALEKAHQLLLSRMRSKHARQK